MRLLTYHKELIFQRPEGSYHVSDVIGYDNHLPSLGVLWGQHCQFPCQHANLQTNVASMISINWLSAKCQIPTVTVLQFFYSHFAVNEISVSMENLTLHWYWQGLSHAHGSVELYGTVRPASHVNTPIIFCHFNEWNFCHCTKKMHS